MSADEIDYRELYWKALREIDALEKSNTRLHERDALNTESSGMQCAEIRRLKAELEALKAKA